ncbi:hypothetical protein C8R47DRAFT_372971 [Mycena vitilis]|nr:hypothetical protein C8R47DRAFT_372971 [Mycena vitilis]
MSGFLKALCGQSQSYGICIERSDNGYWAKAPDSFFKYTSSRWLYNEKSQLEARFLKFDWQALKRTAGQVVGARCVDMTKHAEDFFAGSELIAKIPTPLAGHPHLSTASEVAIMDYARTILKLPVPRVISWCSRADKTDVGAEYILMERAPGRELFKLWNPSLSNTSGRVPCAPGDPFILNPEDNDPSIHIKLLEYFF